MPKGRKELDGKALAISIKIAEEAAKLFRRKGYLETTMDAIADAAKVSKGGIYYYFKNKGEVLYFILSNYMDLVLGGLEDKLSGLKTGDEKLKCFISIHIDKYCKNTNEAKSLMHESHCLPPNLYKEIVKKQREYYQIAFDILTECLNEKVDKHNLTTLTFLLFGMCNWNYSWYNTKGPITPSQLSDLISTIFLDGIKGVRQAGD